MKTTICESSPSFADFKETTRVGGALLEKGAWQNIAVKMSRICQMQEIARKSMNSQERRVRGRR